MKIKSIFGFMIILLLASCGDVDKSENNEQKASKEDARNKTLSTTQTIDSPLIPFSNSIPAPADMKVDVVVSGRVSTLNNMEVLKVGKQIPYTYSHGRITNTPGYDWFVSKHFALKSNRPEDQVLLYMELLEMSYPHYIELFGMTPPNIENQRMAAVYGSSRKQTEVLMSGDGMPRGVNGGGEAMFYNLAGYSFPSAHEQHQRYIVIHEQGHVFQMALMGYSGWLPSWYVEGTADALAHHYYDPEKKQLKVMVFDRASPMDYVRMGLRQYEKLNKPSIQDLQQYRGRDIRGINFLTIHFMLDDPDRSHKFKTYRDEMARSRAARSGDGKELSHQMMVDIFGDWDKVEADFREYVANIDKTFNYAAGPWEVDGNKLWVHVLNNRYDQGSPRYDVLLKPGEKPYFKSFKFDYPAPDFSPLIREPARGVDNPTVAVAVDYQAAHLRRGHVGIGLGLDVTEENLKRIEVDKTVGTYEEKTYLPDEDELLHIKVLEADTLVVDGRTLGADLLKYSLPVALISDLGAQEQPQLGLSVTINQEHLSILVKSKNQSHEEQYPISTELRENLLNRPMAILAENAEHRVTPFFDDGRHLNPVPRDLGKNQEVNPWSNPADQSITRLFRTIWRLGDKAPEALKTLYADMIAATPKDRATQQASLDKFNASTKELVQAIMNSGADKEAVEQALVELSGLHLRLEWRQENPNGEQTVSAILRNNSGAAARANVVINQEGGKRQTQSLSLAAGDRMTVDLSTTPDSRASDKDIQAVANVEWQGQQLILRDSSGARPYPWSSMAIVEGASLKDGSVNITAEFRGPHADKAKGVLIAEAYPSHLFEEPVIEEEVSIEAYEVKQFNNTFKLKEGSVGKPYAVDIRFELTIDGEPVFVKERSHIK